MNAIFRPIQKWPHKETPRSSRRRSVFRASYADTLDLLERELNQLRAKDVVIQADFEQRDIRNDGWPRSSARPRGPRVIVSGQTTKGPLSFPCDTYTDWEDNLRAIALSLQALRAVDRYGVTHQAEQYKGWTQLPAAAASMSQEEAAHLVVNLAGAPFAQSPNVVGVIHDPELFHQVYRAALRNAHPDAGGQHEVFLKLQQAADVLRRLHGTAI